jgi:hypothetical protein
MAREGKGGHSTTYLSSVRAPSATLHIPQYAMDGWMGGWMDQLRRRLTKVPCPAPEGDCK